ncbi:MAG: Clp protease N-terminal domain-containing protein, partial [Calditrichia bacterium]
MNLEKFTIKAQEALTSAQQAAMEHGHQQMEPQHVLQAILSDKEGVINTLLKKMGVEPQEVNRRLEQSIAKLPKVSGGTGPIYASPQLKEMLNSAA